MSRRIAIIFLAIIILPLGIKCQPNSRPEPVPYCQQSNLDVYALPPTNSSPVPGGHLLVFEIQNIGNSVCQVDSPVAQPYPKLSDWEEIENFKLLPDGTWTRNGFGQTQLAPGDWVYILLGWTSLNYPFWQCLEHSGLNLLLTSGSHGATQVSPVIVDVRNLQMRSCGGVFLSGYLKGRYVPDTTVIDKWLQFELGYPGIHLHIPKQTTSLQDLQTSPLFQVSSRINRMLLGEYFSLDLKVPGQADNFCDFRSLRKRESDGTTVISFQNCPEPTGLPQQSQPDSLEPIQTRVDLRALGMLPKSAGSVTYDLVADLGTSAAPSLAKAHIDLIAHDPTPPTQASIMNPRPDCAVSQLNFVSPLPGDKGCQKILRAYEATNNSTQACSLAGVPDVQGNFALNLAQTAKMIYLPCAPTDASTFSQGKQRIFLWEPNCIRIEN
jgi:hypothetical protein